MIAAIYIYPNSYPHLFGEDHEEITINFGAKYLYEITLDEDGGRVDVSKKPNPTYIEPVFSKLMGRNLLGISCIVGNNGAGKSTLLRDILVDYRFLFLYERGEDFEIIDLSHGANYYANTVHPFHRLYYSPVLNFETLGGVGNNSVDWSKTMQFYNDNHGDSGQLEDFVNVHKSEYIKRWIRFNDFYLSSDLNIISFPFFKEVNVKLGYFPHTSYDRKYHDTPYQFRSIIDLLFDKIKKEQEGIYRDFSEQGRDLSDMDDRRIKFEYRFYEGLLGKIIASFESVGNRFLNEGFIPDDLEDKMTNLPFNKAFLLFLENIHVFEGEEKYYFRDLQYKTKNLLEFFTPIIKNGNISEDNWTVIKLSYKNTVELIDLYEDFNNFFLVEPFRYNAQPLFIYSPDINLSSGEQAVLNLFGTLYHHIYCIKNNISSYDSHSSDPFKYIDDKILLLIDEGDSGFHPAWKKRYIELLRKVVPHIYKDYMVQIIITTHDPITLSDFPRNNIVYLQKKSGRTTLLNSEEKKAFAANVSDLLEDSFFLENGLIGEWSNDVVKKFIDLLKNDDLVRSNLIEDDVKVLLNSIDEPIIRFKLAEMYTKITNKKNVERELLDQEIRVLQNRRKDLD